MADLRVDARPGRVTVGSARDQHATDAAPRRPTWWAALGENWSGTAYGTIAVGLLIAAEDPAVETYAKVVEGTIVAIALYWVAHSYAHILGQRFTTRRAAGWNEIMHAFIHELGVVWGATTPLVALLAGWIVGAELETTVAAALWTAALTLLVLEVIGGMRAGVSRLALVGNAVIGAVLGGALFAVKLILH